MECTCALTFSIQDARSFQDVFGTHASQVADEDIKSDFLTIASDLLERYHITSEVISPSFGTWYILFSARKSMLPLDISEQFRSLMTTARAMAREMLQSILGVSTGSNIDFRVGVMHIPEELDSGKKIEKYIMSRADSIPQEGRPHAMVEKEDMLRIIREQDISIFLLPIVSLKEHRVVGYEALSKGPQDSPVRDAVQLFGTAFHYGLQTEMEMACLSKAIEICSRIRKPHWITINIGPDTLISQEFLDLLRKGAIRDDAPHMTFEITEHTPIRVTSQLQKVAGELSEQGIELALDDTGCGFAHLDTVARLRPSLVKLCITITRCIGREPHIAEDISNTVNAISGYGAQVLAEGVEREDQAEVLKKSGVSLVQGFYYGQPLSTANLFAA